MARLAGGQDDEEIQTANGVVYKRRRMSESASESQPQRQIHQSQTVQLPRPQRVCPSWRVEEEEGVVALEEGEFLEYLRSGGVGTEEEDYFGSEEDEEVADGVAEVQHQHHQVTASTLPPLQPGQANPGGGLRSCGMVNNVSVAIPVVLTDPDVLDCPICLNPLCSPVYQCENGHITCSSCCNKSKLKCHSCCLPTGINRCRAMENLLESIRVECENTKFGCKEISIYHKKAEHEQMCPYTACFCPLPSCEFANSSKNLYAHFSSDHAASATSFTYDKTFYLGIERSETYMILQERNEGAIFILNIGIQGHGRVFNVDCIGPNTFKGAFVYQLSVKCLETSLSLESVPEVCSKWQQHIPNKNYLTIPSDLSGYGGRLFVLTCIKKARPVM